MNPNEIFWLARYAHTQLEPLMADLKAAAGCDVRFSIEAVFAADNRPGHIGVFVHWDRDDMFLYSPRHSTKADIDKLAVTVKEKTAALRPLEVGIPA